jgi:hypothetical protein
MEEAFDNSGLYEDRRFTRESYRQFEGFKAGWKACLESVLGLPRYETETIQDHFEHGLKLEASKDSEWLRKERRNASLRAVKVWIDKPAPKEAKEKFDPIPVFQLYDGRIRHGFLTSFAEKSRYGGGQQAWCNIDGGRSKQHVEGLFLKTEVNLEIAKEIIRIENERNTLRKLMDSKRNSLETPKQPVEVQD